MFDSVTNCTHDFILTNDTEVFQQLYHSQHADELKQLHEFKDEMVIKPTVQEKALSVTPHNLPGIVESNLFRLLRVVHDVWINVCAVLMSLYT